MTQTSALIIDQRVYILSKPDFLLTEAMLLTGETSHQICGSVANLEMERYK